MFGSATFSADYLKGPSLPLTYTELAVRIRRRVILSTVGHADAHIWSEGERRRGSASRRRLFRLVRKWLVSPTL